MKVGEVSPFDRIRSLTGSGAACLPCAAVQANRNASTKRALPEPIMLERTCREQPYSWRKARRTLTPRIRKAADKSTGLHGKTATYPSFAPVARSLATIIVCLEVRVCRLCSGDPFHGVWFRGPLFRAYQALYETGNGAERCRAWAHARDPGQARQRAAGSGCRTSRALCGT